LSSKSGARNGKKKQHLGLESEPVRMKQHSMPGVMAFPWCAVDDKVLSLTILRSIENVSVVVEW